MSEISNPFSTGAGGASFEHKIQTSFVLQMLLKSPIPCLPKGEVEYIRLQARQAGIHTDDIAISLITENQLQHKLFGQIKHSITFTESNDVFNAVMEEFWQDFNNPNVFNKENDSLVIITGPLSEKVIKHFRPLFEWARHSQEANEFFQKVATNKFSSEAKRTYLQAIRNISNKINGEQITDQRLWEFLKTVHILGYDFDQQESIHKSQILTLIELSKVSACPSSSEDIWSRMLEHVAQANQNAGTITLNNLPAAFTDWVKPSIQHIKNPTFYKLKHHNQIILDAIDNKINQKIHIDRTAIQEETLNKLENNQITLITGAAGSGKSALAKDLLLTKLVDLPQLIFKIEEFNQPHLDNVFNNIGIDETFKDWFSRFTLHPEKVILIEGLEKIFELTHQDTFKQFLTFIKKDPSIKLLGTCRIQSINSLKTNVFFPLGLKPLLLSVPLLTDNELLDIKIELQHLSNIFENHKLNKLLHTPLYLKLACFINWDNSSNKEINPNDFKQLIWDMVIRKTSHTVDGLPLKRNDSFMNVAIMRAKKMKMFVSPQGCDHFALQKLLEDNIIISSNDGYAPSHDLFEDLALERFIKQQYEMHSSNVTEFFNNIGIEPAMRRAFRLWLIDNIDTEDNFSLEYFIADAMLNPTIPQFWRDEILTVILQSEKPELFFQQQKEKLLENNAQFLIRVLHILNVACKVVDERIINLFIKDEHEKNVLRTNLLVPNGKGWSHTIKFIYANKKHINSNHTQLIYNTLECWINHTKNIPNNDVDGLREAGLLSLYLYERLEKEYYFRALRDGFLYLALQIPNHLEEELQNLIGIELQDFPTKNSYTSKRLFELILSFPSGTQMCKYMPQTVLSIASTLWIKNKDINSDMDNFYNQDIEDYFGLRCDHPVFTVPSSAFRGPFLTLLRTDYLKTIDFMIDIINHATNSYINSELASDEEPMQINIRLNDGTNVLQWGNTRLWNLYRGTSVGPYLIQSLLMALEFWLFELIENKVDQKTIKDIFEILLKKSNSASISAVLTSVVIAHPELFQSVAFPLFRTKEFIEWDILRTQQDAYHISDLRSLLGIPSGGMDEIFHSERLKSDQKPHRKTHLEEIIFKLQITTLKEDIFNILDEHLENLNQTRRNNKKWEITLNRMDIRKYEIESGNEDRETIILKPQEPDKEIQAFIQEQQSTNDLLNKKYQLLNWSMNKFNNPTASTDTDWKEMFTLAEIIKDEAYRLQLSEYDSTLSYFAAVVLKDFGNELETEQKQWCRSILLKVVKDEIGDLIKVDGISNKAFDGSRPGIYILPLLMDDEELLIKELIFKSLIHPNKEIRSFMIRGIHDYLWENDPDFINNCIAGIVLYSKWSKENSKNHMNNSHEIKKHIKDICNKVLHEKFDDYDSFNIDLNDHIQTDIIYALALIPFNTKNQNHKKLFYTTLTSFINLAKEKDTYSHYLNRKINYQAIHTFADVFSKYVLSQENGHLELCAPLINNSKETPELVSIFLSALITAEDYLCSTDIFWELWTSFSNHILTENFLNTLPFQRENHNKMIRTLLFVESQWKENVTEWKTLQGKKHFIKEVCTRTGHYPIVFSSLVKFFHVIGAEFLPEGYIWLSQAVKKGDATKLLGNKYTIMYLEKNLQKTIHTMAIKIIEQDLIKHSIIHLLDELVNHGSSVAFQLREYIVTPLLVEK